MNLNDKDFRLFLLALSRMTFLNFNEKNILLKKLDSLGDLVVLSIEDIKRIINRGSKAVWNGENTVREAKKDLYILEHLGIKYVSHMDSDYPELLREINDPPFLLFYRGDISVLKKQCVSVVGTRKITASGAAAALKFAEDACLDGINVISGLAYGVDRKVHEGALNALEKNSSGENTGKTIAVIPGGIDNIVPAGNKRLASRILMSGGCIISEYPPSAPAETWRFVQRNRIIAALSPATVVIQAPPGSGAMLTAEFAVDYNREVMFHKASFSEESQKISAFEKKRLLYLAAKEKGAENKLKNDPVLFVNDGAPVIENYADYVKCLSEAPEHRSARQQKIIQGELFN